MHRRVRELEKENEFVGKASASEVWGGTYGAARIQCALTRGGVDVGVRAVAASIAPPGPDRITCAPASQQARWAVGLWPMRTTAPASGTKARLTACVSRTLPTCGARKAGSTCAPCAMRTRAECSDRPWVSGRAPTWSSPRSTWPLPPAAASPAGVVLHADRGTQFTSQKLAAYMRAEKGTVSMGQAQVCWDNAMAESLWATLTTEYYYRRTVATRDQVYTGVATWIEDSY